MKKPSIKRTIMDQYRKLSAALRDAPPDEALRAADELRRLAGELLSLPGATPSLIPTSVVAKWFSETAQALGCCPPPSAVVQSYVEIVHDVEYYSSVRRPESEIAVIAGLRVQAIVEDTAIAVRATDDLLRVLPGMIEFARFGEEGPPDTDAVDPRLIATVRQLGEEAAERRGGDDPWSEEGASDRSMLETYLAVAREMQRRWGSAPTRGRRPQFWTMTARLLALPTGEAWAQAGVRTSYQSADGPLLAVLAKAVHAIEGVHVQTKTLATALRRHHPLRAWNLQK